MSMTLVSLSTKNSLDAYSMVVNLYNKSREFKNFRFYFKRKQNFNRSVFNTTSFSFRHSVKI